MHTPEKDKKDISQVIHAKWSAARDVIVLTESLNEAENCDRPITVFRHIKALRILAEQNVDYWREQMRIYDHNL